SGRSSGAGHRTTRAPVACEKRDRQRTSPRDCLARANARSLLYELTVDVLDDLVSPRPLLGWDDEVDLAPTEAIERVIRDAIGLQAHASEVVAPRHRRRLLLEHADRLPAFEARVANRHRLFLRDTTVQETRDRHTARVAPR